MKVTVRGLCLESIFDREYTYTIREDGSPSYMGIHTSTVLYNHTEKLWHWIDRFSGSSVATSESLEARFLLGINKFSMANVVHDKCTDTKEDKTMIIKFTACVEGL